ncbi:uncharacterized protein LOC116119340 [Pistacia vera]|uniref:uncharacterized protein LOC116119340 n=1 Tax=Pistacia vera TaxID=55513 RepID=UPI001263CB3D|nr:uncharacterized protein LOC116119340 [Pistacia vera]
MNFNFGGPSHLSSSNSSSFSDNEIDDEELMNDLEAIDVEQEAILRMRANNNLLLLHYLNQQNNQVIRRGPNPGHRVINRNRETADRNLFNDYFADNHGQYVGRSGSPTIILEAVADYDPWIWHAFFGLPGSNNDINVLEASHLFANLTQGIAPSAHYIIQGKEYNMGYYLADGIYPKWSTLVQTIHDPRGPKKKLFAMKQEGCRKDVERAFGVLQSRFAIVAGPTRFWGKKKCIT